MALPSTESTIDNTFKVKLRGSDGIVTFDVTPDFIETRNVNYANIEPIHQPGQIYIYKNTSSRNFNISNGKMISRTPVEADRNLRRLHMLRGWTMPRFGAKSSTLDGQQYKERQSSPELLTQLRAQGRRRDAVDFFGIEVLGAPPQVLLLSAYSDAAALSGRAKSQHIDRVPVVIQQLNIPYPSDVDYIPTTTGVPMPIIMTVDVTLVETHSATEYEHFSLDQYRQGRLRSF